MVDYPHTEYDYSGLSLTDVSKVVAQVYNLCRVLNYSNSRVRGHGRLDGHTVPLSDVFLKMTCDLKGEFDLITTEL